MKCTIPEISWHNRDPVLSVDIQPNKANDFYRLASGGTDSHVLIWLLSVEKYGVASLECAADLTRHTKPVNCVRFSPSGDLLASGDDESCIIVWKLKTSSDPVEFPNGEEETFKEQWTSVKVLRGHLQDVYDLSWSADSKNLISGSVDNTAILWEMPTGKNLAILGEHKGFVQGVAWDPCGQYVATISSDRTCRIYNTSSRRVVTRICKGTLPGVEAEAKPTHFFHDDTLKSFFRRLTFTPDGELLIVPSGVVEEAGKKPSNATMIFSRSCLNKPVMYLPSLGQYTVAVRCCPVLFTHRPMLSPPLFDMPYRVVIAVATQCSVILYDTQHAAPFAFITKIHYTRLTDLTWSSDGRVIVVSSTDGYCSVITFAENELGTVYKGDNDKLQNKNNEETKTSNLVNKENMDIKTKTELPGNSTGNSVESMILGETEDANMGTNFISTKEENVQLNLKEDPKSKQSEKPVEIKPVGEPKDTAMEVDDFQLVYEGTITEAVLEKKDASETNLSVHLNKTNSSPEKKVEPQENPPIIIDKPEPSLESPVKNMDTTKIQQESLSSPVSSSTSAINVTPGNSNKKTPRRVQLITLSSPKSKKKLLQ